MLQGKHSAILSTFINLPFVIKMIVLSIFEWSFYTCFTVMLICHPPYQKSMVPEHDSPQASCLILPVKKTVHIEIKWLIWIYLRMRVNGHTRTQMQYSASLNSAYPMQYSETGLKWSLKNGQNKGLRAMWKLNAGQTYCRMLHGSILKIHLPCIE